MANKHMNIEYMAKCGKNLRKHMYDWCLENSVAAFWIILFPIHTFVFLITELVHYVPYCCNGLSPMLNLLSNFYYQAPNILPWNLSLCHWMTEWLFLSFQPSFQTCMFLKKFYFLYFLLYLYDYQIFPTWS